MKATLCSMLSGLIILSVVAPVSRPAVLASPDYFAGGDGSTENPYHIADWYHLNSVRDHLDCHFILMNDLDSDTDGYANLAGPAANGARGWQPIGGSFSGKFDGRGYEIRDLFVDRPTEAHVGVFGLLMGGVVESVGVANAAITGQHQVGGLVASNWGTVSHCRVTGNVKGDVMVGGLVASNWGTVSNCYAMGSVTGSSAVGSLVGDNDGTVCNCYATGSVIGDYNVGGLAGESYGTVSNCYATGSVTGDNWVGGLVGVNGASVSNCYSTGSVTGSSAVGGLVGEDHGTVSNCFWDEDTSGMATSDGGTGKATIEMQDIATYREEGTIGLTWPWDILSVVEGATLPYADWNVVDGEGYPFLTFRQVEIEVTAGWNMVSVPGGLAESANTVAAVFGNQIVAIYYWNPVAKSYEVPTVLEPGQGYWVAVTEDKTLILRI